MEGLSHMKFAAVLALLAASALPGNAAIKVFIHPILSNYPTNWYSMIEYYDTTQNQFIWQKICFLPRDNSILTYNDAIAYMVALAYTEASNKGYSITNADFVTEFPLNGLFDPNLWVYNTPSRSLNTAFQISATRPSRVSYAVSVASTISLTTGETGTVVLEYADDSGFTTNVKTVQSTVNGNTGTLTLGLNLVQTVTTSVSGDIPVGKYVRIRTANTSGTPVFTMGTAQEIIL